MTRRQVVVTAAAVVWTFFVWGGRIRNGLDDDALDGAALAGVVVLSLSFLVPAAAVGAVALRDRRRGPSSLLERLVVVVLVWNTVVWAVRLADIAFAGHHEVGFVIVHVGLGVVSVALWALTARRLIETGSEEIRLSS